jgi:outer membrane murein-binding lipoprotein Lpp
MKNINKITIIIALYGKLLRNGCKKEEKQEEAEKATLTVNTTVNGQGQVAGVLVSLRTSSNNTVKEARTNNQGIARFEDVEAGIYDVYSSLSDYSSWERNISIAESEDKTISTTLIRMPTSFEKK